MRAKSGSHVIHSSEGDWKEESESWICMKTKEEVKIINDQVSVENP